MKDFKIIKTKDGSSTLISERLEETYHSIHGAITESLHVFIQNGLQLYTGDMNEIHILEVGLGTGLNALLTLENAKAGTNIYYTAIEPFPLPYDITLAYYNDFENKPKEMKIIEKIFSPVNREFASINENFNFCCINKKLQEISIKEITEIYRGYNKTFDGFDILYYDAFGPPKQPEMWSLETLQIAVDLLKTGGIFTTYCAQGQFKRNLRTIGMQVESLKGPPGKREMTVAKK